MTRPIVASRTGLWREHGKYGLWREVLARTWKCSRRSPPYLSCGKNMKIWWRVRSRISRLSRDAVALPGASVPPSTVPASRLAGSSGGSAPAERSGPRKISCAQARASNAALCNLPGALLTELRGAARPPPSAAWRRASRRPPLGRLRVAAAQPHAAGPREISQRWLSERRPAAWTVSVFADSHVADMQELRNPVHRHSCLKTP